VKSQGKSWKGIFDGNRGSVRNGRSFSLEFVAGKALREIAIIALQLQKGGQES